ncbi:hypothetical protein IB69_017765 [Xanthomonas citri]|nr:hypothetical protein IB69_017765 [Xanthomonas citri]
MLLLQKQLRALGFDSEIFVEHLDPRLAGQLRQHTDLPVCLSPQDILIVQHSMGHDLLDWVLSLQARKVLMYHNITPANFFSVGSAFHRYSLIGRKQLKQIQSAVEGAVAVSDYNARELREIGFERVDVLPILVRDDHYAGVLAPRCLEASVGRPWTVLFVGRICENKGHLELVEAAKSWLESYPAFPIQFVCVGSHEIGSEFYSDVHARIASFGLSGIVRFTGKITDEELLDWYARADCYLSLSRHEGFGVPLIEAMLCDLPVIALDAAAVAETMGGAGILLPDADPQRVSRELFHLMRSRSRRREIINAQRIRADNFRSNNMRVILGDILERMGIRLPASPELATGISTATEVRIEGPCDSSYSLAIVNRELGLALDDAGAQTCLFCTEGPGDYQPSEQAIDALEPRVRVLLQSDAPGSIPDLVIRNLYPPRVRDARGQVNAGYFFWEESSFPAQYAADFNISLDVLLAPSRFVMNVWRNSGVNVPIHYVGTGADHILDQAAEQLPTALPEGYRFLHISSCFPRKGPDVLLRAWGRAFAGRKDVHLVIKTFSNPHNEVPGLLKELRKNQPDYPPVTLLLDEYTPGQLRNLYRECDAYVAPSRGEGFGLPMAEAMLHDLPVIATGWGGHSEFCTEQTAFPIRYQLKPSSSHVAGSDSSLWAEPDEDHLVELLRQVQGGQFEGTAARVANAHGLIKREYSWESVARRVTSASAAVRRRARDFSLEPLRLGWVSTWNETCGIATYSRYLLENLPLDEVSINIYGRIGTSRPDGRFSLNNQWSDASEASLERLADTILADNIEVVVFQFNFGFFNVDALGALTSRLEKSNVRVLLVLHSTKDVDKADFKATLRDAKGVESATRILVHSLDDLNRLIDYGLGGNAAIFPHGAMDGVRISRQEARDRLEVGRDAKIIASYGFMLPHKGLPELVEAFAELSRKEPNAYLFMINSLFPDPISEKLRDKLLARIERLGIREKVRFFTEFLPEQTGLNLLQAADIVVFPYQDTAESASGAVRFGLAAHRPVACTPLGIFSDLEGQGLRFRGCTPEELAQDLRQWLNDDNIESVVQGQDEWIKVRSWPRLMIRLLDMSRGLVLDHDAISEQNA